MFIKDDCRISYIAHVDIPKARSTATQLHTVGMRKRSSLPTITVHKLKWKLNGKLRTSYKKQVKWQLILESDIPCKRRVYLLSVLNLNW